MKNLIDITLTTEQRAAMNDAAVALKTAMPFLLGFSPEQRKAMFKAGPRRQSFARLALEIGRQKSGFLPANFDLGNIERDLELYDALTPIRLQLAEMLRQVTDTQTAAGRDACEGGLEVYRALKNHGRDASLDPLIAALGDALKRRPEREEERADANTVAG
ncbi:MAG: hypothetical protein ACO1QR_15165 [Chthoniobacteraceae bacterium]